MDDSAVMRLRGASLAAALLIVSVLLPWQNLARAHVFVNRSEPRSGATLGAPPAQIRIWFDGPVESLFAAIRVESGDKRRVDKDNGRVNRATTGCLRWLSPRCHAADIAYFGVWSRATATAGTATFPS